MTGVILWLAIVSVIMFLARREKPLTKRQQAALDHQSAYARKAPT